MKEGFSLLELLIVLAIVGIVLTLAYPAYTNYVLKTHRSEAMQTLFSIQFSEEQYRTNNALYGTLAQAWGGVTSTPSGRYNLSISNVSANSYTVTATAQGAQVNDKEGAVSCTPIVLAVNNSVVSTTPLACW